ncbi:MAG: hypothetical protein U1G08_08295 [Verrucomicrobiota bacterium]
MLRPRTIPLLLALLPALSGCHHLGPKTVAVDRYDYSAAIADSWKQQTLLNIVKLRYMDLPVFVDVASIVSGYSLQTGVSVGGTLSSSSAINGSFGTLGGQAIYTDRPTITYVPMTGEKFLRGLITPIDPKNVFFMLQSGYPADFLLGLTVESLNGVRNRSVNGGVMRDADPEFIQALELMREIQLAGAIGMRVEQVRTNSSVAMVFFRDSDVAPEILEKENQVRRLLNLTPGRQRFILNYSPIRGAEGEMAVNSRSLLQIMQAFSSYIDVPEDHRRDQSAFPTLETSAPHSRPDPVRIHSGREKPTNAFASVQYRDHWYWVENSDWKTKRALTAVMFFFTLTDAGSSEKLPLVTIPAQ